VSRRLLAIVVIVFLLLVALVGFYIWLSGGEGSDTGTTVQEPPRGIVHVRSIYTANGENLYRPVGIGADANGDFAVTLRDSQRVILFDRRGGWIRSWGKRGLAAGELLAPVGVAYDRASDHVYVADRSRLRLIAYSSQGTYLWELPLLNPLTPVVGPDGVLVTTFGPLVTVSTEGEVLEEIGSRGPDPGQFDYPRGGAFLGATQVVVADTNNLRVQRVQLDGAATATVEWVKGEPPTKQDDPGTEFGLPSSLALDDQNRVYVLDGFRHAIVVLHPDTGEELYKFEDLDGDADGSFNLPTAIAYLGGDSFAITDTYNDRVQIIRIIMPEDDTIVRRYPWILWLIPLLSLIPLFLLGRKRWYATVAALDAARDAGQLRLVVAVARQLAVTPDLKRAYAMVEEEDVSIGPYLTPVGEDGTPETGNERLLETLPTGIRALFGRRVRVVCASEAECDEFAGRRRKAVLLDDLVAEFRLKGAADAAAGEPEADGAGDEEAGAPSSQGDPAE
jgi:DNA-binding beta-propeller fold protein YncE